MKKLLFIFTSALLLSSVNIKAQITLDTTINNVDLAYLFKPVKISSNETKYYFTDTLTNTFSLYNLDFTPFLTNISVPEPFRDAMSNLFQVLYLSRTLFDCDSSNIEYAYTTPGNINNPFRIMRTDGTIIFQIDSANAPFCFGNCLGGSGFVTPIINTEVGAKLFLQKSNLGYQQRLIYSLCGDLPTEIIDFENKYELFINIFPNPSAGKIMFQINAPDNVNEYELVIFDHSAKEVKREKIRPENDMYLMDVRNLSSGAYYYSLCTKNQVYKSGKFILTK